MTRHPSVFVELAHMDREALLAHPVIFDLLIHECAARSNMRNAVLFRFATGVRLPFLSQLHKTCTKLDTDSGPLRVWPSRPRSAFLVASNHATSSCCGLVLPQLLSIQGSSLSAFTGRNSCTFDGTYSEARPDPFPDAGCASTSFSNCPPRRTKLITSPVLRCSAQLPSAVKCTSWPVANKSREPSDVASSRCQT